MDWLPGVAKIEATGNEKGATRTRTLADGTVVQEELLKLDPAKMAISVRLTEDNLTYVKATNYALHLTVKEEGGKAIREGEGNAVKILHHLDVDLEELRRSVEGSMEPASAMRPPDKDKITLIKQAEKMLKITFLEAKLFKSPHIDTEHLLLSILKDEDNLATRTLHKFNVDYESVKNEVDAILAGGGPSPASGSSKGPKAQGPQSADDDDEESGSGYSGGQRKPADSKSKTPVLDNFGRDLTKLAEDGKLDPIVGR